MCNLLLNFTSSYLKMDVTQNWIYSTFYFYSYILTLYPYNILTISIYDSLDTAWELTYKLYVASCWMHMACVTISCHIRSVGQDSNTPQILTIITVT